jgi:hypothetical protein
MGGAIPPFPIYAFMSCIEMTIFLPFVYLQKNYTICCGILKRVYKLKPF